MKIASRALFTVTAAIAAAALIDPLVEGLSNAHAFGGAVYTDQSNLDVLPALAIAALLATAFLGLAVARAFRREGTLTRWIRASAIHLDPLSVRRLLPAIFALQLATLFSMETLEQLVVHGSLEGGTIWLGGPVAVSLLVHAVGCCVISFVLSRGLQALAKRIVDAVCFVLGTMVLRRDREPVRHVRREPVTMAQFLEPFIELLQGRAPPQPAV